MKTLIEVHKEGKYFVAVDLLTNVADQGSSEEEAVGNLRKGLEEHYHLQDYTKERHEWLPENLDDVKEGLLEQQMQKETEKQV